MTTKPTKKKEKGMIKIRNYCICKIRKGVLYREQDCPARFHTGNRGWIEYDPEALWNEMRSKRSKIGWLGHDLEAHDY